MASKSSLKNMALCLSAVCLVCSALLAGTYALSYEPIEAAKLAKINKSVAVVLPAFEGDVVQSTFEGTDYYKAETGIAVISSSVGFGGKLTLMVGIDNQGVVYNTTVLEHSETPGLGAKCKSDKKFLNQFMALDPSSSKIIVRKDGGDIDAITGSTITSRAYCAAVENALKVYGGIINE